MATRYQGLDNPLDDHSRGRFAFMTEHQVIIASGRQWGDAERYLYIT